MNNSTIARENKREFQTNANKEKKSVLSQLKETPKENKQKDIIKIKKDIER